MRTAPAGGSIEPDKSAWSEYTGSVSEITFVHAVLDWFSPLLCFVHNKPRRPFQDPAQIQCSTRLHGDPQRLMSILRLLHAGCTAETDTHRRPECQEGGHYRPDLW